MLAMTVQDDKREQQMRDRFNLKLQDDRKRDGIDAVLKIDDRTVNFELKSTTNSSFSTVRDFGASHIEKWKDLHWIFAFYTSDGKDIVRCHYASPVDMAEWINERAKYVLPDVILGREISRKVTPDIVRKIFDGREDPFSVDDAKWVMKNQWKAHQYAAAADEAGTYSMEKMVEILRERCAYVMARGSTLNNPHIPGSYIERLPLLDEDEPAGSLRSLVRLYFASASATDAATE